MEPHDAGSRTVQQGFSPRRVADGRLESNDGLVSLDGLAKLYPDWRPDDSGAFERTAKLRDEAFGRRVQERVLPPQEVLAQRMFAQSRELADARRHLARYHELYRELGSYPYDRDPGRPGWFSHVPNRDWADPADARVPALGH